MKFKFIESNSCSTLSQGSTSELNSFAESIKKTVEITTSIK